MPNRYLDQAVEVFCMKDRERLECMSLTKSWPDGSKRPSTVTDAFTRMWSPVYQRFAPRHLMITEDGTANAPFLGLISDSDILSWHDVGNGIPVEDLFIKDLMRAKYPDQVVYIERDCSVREALEKLTNPYRGHFISILPVLTIQEGGNALLYGVLSYIDILRNIKPVISNPDEEAIILPEEHK